jgi:hypothetical protein
MVPVRTPRRLNAVMTVVVTTTPPARIALFAADGGASRPSQRMTAYPKRSPVAPGHVDRDRIALHGPQLEHGLRKAEPADAEQSHEECGE